MRNDQGQSAPSSKVEFWAELHEDETPKSQRKTPNYGIVFDEDYSHKSFDRTELWIIQWKLPKQSAA